MIYQFEDFVLDLSRFELRRRGAQVKLQPRAFHLLRLLVESEGRVVSKHKVREEIWSGRIVSESAIASQVLAVRKALEDTKKPHRIVATIHGVGFRFLPAVTRQKKRAETSETIRDDIVTPPIGGAPRLAVLPLENDEANRSDIAIAKGIAADIVSQLTHITGVEIISSNTSVAISQQDLSEPETFRPLAISYLVSGKLSRERKGYVARFELTDVRSNSVIWSDAFAFGGEETESISSDIVAEITHRIGAHVTHREASLARGKPAGLLSGWELYHLGMSSIVGQLTPNYALAENHLSAAIRQCPDFAPAHSAKSRVLIYSAFYTEQDVEIEKTLAAALRESGRAAELDPLNSFANLAHGHALRMNGHLDDASYWAGKAVEIAPNFADAQATMAAIALWTGQYQSAFDHAARAHRLDPLDPMGFENDIHLALAATHLREEATALQVAQRLETSPVIRENSLPLGVALTAYHHAGDNDSAQRVAGMIVERGFHRQRFPLSVLFGNRAEATVRMVAEATGKWLQNISL